MFVVVDHRLAAADAGARGYVLKNPNAQEISEAVVTIAQGGYYYGLGVPRPDTRASSSSRLTPRETEVMRLVAKGLKNELIAQRLGIRSSTVMRHRAQFSRQARARHGDRNPKIR